MYVPKRASANNDLEHEYQVKVIQWCRRNAHNYPSLETIYAVPNGGKRSKKEAGKLKAEGVLAGVCDLALPDGRGGYFGLFIEMKHDAGGSVVGPKQKVFIKRVTEQNFKAIICHTPEAAIEQIEVYLKLENTKCQFTK